MAALTCELCGGKLFGKPGGMFECDSCGMEYNSDWAKAKIQEIKGTVKVEGTVSVKVENAATVPNLVQRGYLALESGSFKDANEAFGKAAELDPNCGEAHLGIAIAGRQLAKRTEYWERVFAGRYRDDPELKKALECPASEPYRAELEAYRALLAKEAAEEAAAKEKGNAKRQEYAALREKYAPARNLLGSGWLHISAEEGCIHDYGTAYGGNDERFKSWRRAVAACNSGITNAVILDDGSVSIQWDDTYGNNKAALERVNTNGPRAVKIVTAKKGYSYEEASVTILREDGTVISVLDGRENFYCKDKIKKWTDMADIAATNTAVLGVRKDGTVLSSSEHFGSGCEKLRDIVAVAVHSLNYEAYLTGDGRVVLSDTARRDTLAGGYRGNPDSVARVEKWTDIIQIAFYPGGNTEILLMGLKADGTMVMEALKLPILSEHMERAEKQVASVRDAVAINGTYVLLRDGSVLVLNMSNDEAETMPQSMNQKWNSEKGAYDEWPVKLVRNADRAGEERQEGIRRMEEAEQAKIRRRNVLWGEKTKLQNDRSKLGLFAAKQKKEIDARLAQIEEELKGL